MFYAPLIAFLEAFAMEVLGRDKKRYGRMRAWGSAAFIVVVLSWGAPSMRTGSRSFSV
jgi:MFS transporter, PPP family, 3-phenylpropionic acid transporter